MGFSLDISMKHFFNQLSATFGKNRPFSSKKKLPGQKILFAACFELFD
jgi:hypothetical protein